LTVTYGHGKAESTIIRHQTPEIERHRGSQFHACRRISLGRNWASLPINRFF